MLLADDHTVVRQGLRALLLAGGDIEVVGEAENGRQAYEMARQLLPDVVVMDLSLPELNGLDATRQILKDGPGIEVLVVVLLRFGQPYESHQVQKARCRSRRGVYASVAGRTHA